MELEIVYPKIPKRKVRLELYIKIAHLVLLAAAVICPVVNFLTGGKAWSVIVLMSIYMAWTLLLSPDLVEYNRLSQFTKVITRSCILLALIDCFLVPGWAVEVIPIVSFSALIVSGVLLFTDLPRQKQNMRPMLTLIFLSLVGSAVGLSVWQEESRWAMAIMGTVAFLLLLVCTLVLGSDFLRELKRRFHIQ